MSLKRRSLFTTATLAVAVAALIPFLAASPSEGQRSPAPLSFDIAEDATRFVFDETPVHPDGLPAYGGEFTTQGYIYPAGTLKNENGVMNGVNADGSPQFPDKVLGTWTCFGTHVGDGAKTVTGPWVATTQIFDFGDAAGEKTIVSTGVELVDLNVPVKRAIVGTTGLSNMSGLEQTQVMVGFNAIQGVCLRVRFSD